jgi:hypothetical protein
MIIRVIIMPLNRNLGIRLHSIAIDRVDATVCSRVLVLIMSVFIAATPSDVNNPEEYGEAGAAGDEGEPNVLPLAV